MCEKRVWMQEECEKMEEKGSVCLEDMAGAQNDACCSAAGREPCSFCRTVLSTHSHLSPNIPFSVTHFISRWGNLGADLLHMVSQSPRGAKSRFPTHSVAVWRADAAAHGVNCQMGTDWELLIVRRPHPLDCFSTHHVYSFIISVCSVSLFHSSNCQVPASSYNPYYMPRLSCSRYSTEFNTQEDFCDLIYHMSISS